MIFGLFGVAGAAFTDASTIKYTEAVDVMSTIGVMNGMDAGAFNPTAKLTREQAAKISCYLTMGQTAADSLKATAAPFKDVAAALLVCRQHQLLRKPGHHRRMWRWHLRSHCGSNRL